MRGRPSDKIIFRFEEDLLGHYFVVFFSSFSQRVVFFVNLLYRRTPFSSNNKVKNCLCINEGHSKKLVSPFLIRFDKRLDIIFLLTNPRLSIIRMIGQDVSSLFPFIIS